MRMLIYKSEKQLCTLNWTLNVSNILIIMSVQTYPLMQTPVIDLDDFDHISVRSNGTTRSRPENRPQTILSIFSSVATQKKIRVINVQKHASQDVFNQLFSQQMFINPNIQSQPNLLRNSAVTGQVQRPSIYSKDTHSLANLGSVKEVRQQKITRQKRMNIPKTTLIDRKTGQVISNFNPQDMRHIQQHAEDKEIVQRINRMLIQGQWSYSSLLGKQNQRGYYKDPADAPRDADFPRTLAFVSPQMRINFNKDRQKFVHMIECPSKIKMVSDSLTFGLTPTLSRYFVYGLFGLTKNLQPSLFAVGFATDNIVENRRDEIYYTILKTFIQANNQQLAEQRRQQASKRKQLSRKIREPETIQDDNFIFPDILFCKKNLFMDTAVARIKQEFSINFEAHPSYTMRQETMRQKFMRHQLKKQKDKLNEGYMMIKKMLESNNSKDIDAAIQLMDKHNQNYRFRYKKFQLAQYSFYNFQKRFVGFNTYERYQDPMIQYMNCLVIQKRGDTLKKIMDNILIKEEQQKKKIKKPYEDKGGQLTYNSRLRKLRPMVEPRVLHEIVEQFKIGHSLKIQKEGPTRYTIGSGKNHKKVVVQLKHQMWKCECGYQAKVGIPCFHLMRVLHTQKGTKYEHYIHPSHFKVGANTIETIQL